jgi:hypothetical protein
MPVRISDSESAAALEACQWAPCGMLRLSPAANTQHCQLPSATGKLGRICEKPAPGMRSAKWWPRARGCCTGTPPIDLTS